MNPRQLTTRIVQHTSRALVVSALALGLSTTVLAPAPAVAAPLRPEADPGGPSFSRPDLGSTVWLPNGDTVGRGTRVRINGTVNNNGQGAAVPARITLRIPDGLENISVVQAPAGFRCGQRRAMVQILGALQVPMTEVWCEAGRIGPSTPANLVVEATPTQPGRFGMGLEAETTGNSQDRNERNNIATISLYVE